MARRHRLVIALLASVLLLVAARIALPYLVEDYANKRLAALDSYDGHVGDIDIHLWRGAYSIDGIEIGTSLFATIASVLHNAFISAFARSKVPSRCAM